MSSPLQAKLANNVKHHERRTSSPLSMTAPVLTNTPLSTSPPLASRLASLKKENGSLSNVSSGEGPAPLDLSPQLQRSVLSTVKSRSGSVLSRGFILKTDHYPSGTLLHLFVDDCASLLDRPCTGP